MNRQILAIDIRTTSIVAVLLGTGLKSFLIERCVQIPLPPPEEGQDPLRMALAELRRVLDFDDIDAVISLPADGIIFRTITVPFKDDKKIRQILPFELEPNLPMAVDNLVIDFQKGLEADTTELLTVAVDRNDLDAVMASLADARIRPQLVVPGDFALARSLAYHDQGLPEHALLLSIGLKTTTLFLLVSGKIALARCLVTDPFSTDGIETLALKVRQTVTAFADRLPDGFSPTRIYMSGPALEDEALRTRLIEAMEIPFQAVDLRGMIPKLDMAEPKRWQPWVMNGALAMALVEAEGRPCPNFHRTSSVLRNFWTTYRAYVRGPAIALAAVLLLSMGGVLLENHLLQKRLDQINGEAEAIFAATFPGVRRVGEPFSQMRSELRRIQGGTIDAGQPIPTIRTVDILQQLSQMIPKEIDVLFTRMVLGTDGVTIAGETTGFNAVDDIKNRLEQNDLFKQVTIASANMDRSGNKVRFSLKLEL